jgi:CubicO group peptidase (beta-lactamase class C family)
MDIDKDELLHFMISHTDECGVVGAAVGLFRDGVSAMACTGFADVESRIPVTSSTHFLAGSISKSMVATVVARLVSQGLLSFDDPIGYVVPELAKADWSRRVSVRHLLSQTVVMPAVMAYERGSIDEDAENCFAQFCALGINKPLLSEPGKLWSYGSGWGHLARLVEEVTSRP